MAIPPRLAAVRRGVVCCIALLALMPAGASQAAGKPRYELANHCYAMRSVSDGRLVRKAAEGGRYHVADRRNERYWLKPTELGKFLFHDAGKQLMTAVAGDLVKPTFTPQPAAEWVVREGPSGTSTITSVSNGKALAVSRSSGDLVLVGAASAGKAGQFKFESRKTCIPYPEVELNVEGGPLKGSSPDGVVRGFADTHVHPMQFEFIGGRIHCGRIWHRYGAPYALVDCPDHEPGGTGAALEAALGGKTPHDTTGWPTFKDWPAHGSLTHEQLYYRWLERGWRAGLRVFVNLINENEPLCNVYPHKQNDCNEMVGVRLQLRRTYELENYIDAQSGGPGKGWFRIVRDPFEARRVINQGKLAVLIGIEASKLFDCDVFNDTPECDRAQIDRGLDDVYRAGVSTLYPVHKFDNAFGGVRFDQNEASGVINGGNFLQTGKWWSIEHCPTAESDNPQEVPPPAAGYDLYAGILEVALPPGTAPVYPDPPHCNTLGLTALGKHMVRGMMARRMILDPDHMGVKARNAAMALLKSKRYSGVTSSHSWSTPQTYPRIYALGGFVNPISENSEDFVKDWRKIKAVRNKRFYFGFGFGGDAGGLHSLPGPRANASNPVKYPFKSFDGGVTLDRQRSGERVFDVNVEGVPHYGLFPDWIEDLRKVGGNQIVSDMARGAEAYLQMWERAEGVPVGSCLRSRARFRGRGLGSVRLRLTRRRLLFRAGQQITRGKRAWRYCVSGRKNRKAKVVAVFTSSGKVGLVGSTARGHKARKIGRGTKARKLRGRAKKIGRGLWVRRIGRSKFVYVVRKRRVRSVSVVGRSVGKSRKRIRAYLRLARLR